MNTSPETVDNTFALKMGGSMAARKIATKRCGPIRLTLPISVASDLEKLERALANAAHAVEEGNRHSGWHGGFMQMRNFVIDPASLDVKEAAYTQQGP